MSDFSYNSPTRGKAISVAKVLGEGDLKQLNMRVPADLHLRLKRYAVDHDKKIRDVVIELLKTLPEG